MLLATEDDDDDDESMDNVSWWCHHDNAPHPLAVHNNIIKFYIIVSLVTIGNNGSVWMVSVCIVRV